MSEDFPGGKVSAHPDIGNSVDLEVSEAHRSNTRTKDYLVVSPYKDEPHLLDLSTLDAKNQLIAKALVGLKCMRDDYATATYVDIFNWSEVIDTVRKLAIGSSYEWKECKLYLNIPFYNPN
jgi:hypothetical protein